MESIIVSACILGSNCKYNGENNYNPKIELLKEKYNLIPICPEVFGGLRIPRDPAERIGNKVITINNKDVTDNYLNGANMVLNVVKTNNVKIAILKDGSPACGSTYIYDGTFSKSRVEGFGVLAEILNNEGIKIYTEKTFIELI